MTTVVVPSVRRSRHGRGQEYCEIYHPHFHLGSVIIWLNPVRLPRVRLPRRAR